MILGFLAVIAALSANAVLITDPSPDGEQVSHIVDISNDSVASTSQRNQFNARRRTRAISVALAPNTQPESQVPADLGPRLLLSSVARELHRELVESMLRYRSIWTPIPIVMLPVMVIGFCLLQVQPVLGLLLMTWSFVLLSLCTLGEFVVWRTQNVGRELVPPTGICGLLISPRPSRWMSLPILACSLEVVSDLAPLLLLSPSPLYRVAGQVFVGLAYCLMYIAVLQLCFSIAGVLP
eukprot:CRZ00969.1 hypothetical protein [Spongospora subterranea]